MSPKCDGGDTNPDTLSKVMPSICKLLKTQKNQKVWKARRGYLMAHSVEFKFYETKNSDLFVALLCLTKIRKPSVGQGRYCEPFVCKKQKQNKQTTKKPHLSLSVGLKNQFSKREARSCINDDTSIQEKKKKKSRAFPKCSA